MIPDEATSAAWLKEQVDGLGMAPSTGTGRGIVIPGGGVKYFTCAWVCIRMLRQLGCHLPIELWYLGAAELSGQMRELVEPFGVRVVDGLAVRETIPARILNGWELKPYAMIHSRFREVLLLDADNVPVFDPTYLFDSPEYLRCGAVFWPDYGRLGPDRSIWKLTGVAYRDEPEFETGQVLVNKERCGRALALTMLLNEYSDFFYQHIHGDKETFHLAWRRLGQEYAMPPFPIRSLPGVMCQHDFQGRRIFQHRNMAKWKMHCREQVPGFVHEAECMRYLAELEEKWPVGDMLAE